MLCLSSKLEAIILLLLASPNIPFARALYNVDLITVTPAQPLPKGVALVSPNSDFKLQFSPGNRRTGHYLGIWFRGEVVWVANREKRLPATAAGVLKIIITSESSTALVLADNKTGTVYWSSADPTHNGSRTTTTTGAKTASARLEDSGNLVLRDGSSGVVWQSFDYPTDTLLPGMKIGWDNRTGMRWSLRSWTTPDNPSPGNYTYSLDPGRVPQLFVRGPGGIPKTFLGYFNGEIFSSFPDPKSSATLLTFDYVADEEKVYYSYRLVSATMRSRLVLDHLGIVQRYIWQPQAGRWEPLWVRSESKCYNYESCGPNSVCSSLTSSCSCLKGYDLLAAATGCTRKAAGSCDKADAFEKSPGMKLPEMTNATMNMSMTPNQCQETCAGKCSCVAYAIANITSSSGCVMWDGPLVDTEQFANGGQELFVRLTSGVGSNNTVLFNRNDVRRSKQKNLFVIIIISSFIFITFALLTSMLLWKRSWKKRGKARKGMNEEINRWGEEVSLFDLSTIASSTDNFAIANKIGQGGFGAVYKGIINDGQQIAVKRLALTSGQGIDEFMNEVKLIARLQHKNLVRLLGCCIDENETILVYEYMQNKSLEKFIFGKCEDISLDWTQRVNIIHGIARGLLYLHEDSRLKIIHRDLKAANVLLDRSMNPKISDFGTARIFEADQKEESTKRVIGTIGYMSPEYAIEGKYSVKSDVFSFGVILLEIISGLENMKSQQVPSTLNEENNLLASAWKHWQEGESLKLLDPTLVSKCPNLEVVRYIQIGLLCIQESPIDRPTMSEVVLFLNSDIHLLLPTRPGIFHGRKGITIDVHSSPSSRQESLALLTITEAKGR